MLINKENLKALNAGFKVLHDEAYAATETTWEEIAMVVNSTSASETYGFLGKTTQFRKWLGDRVIQSLSAHGYTIVNETFENTVGVMREDIEDDKVGLLKPSFQQLGVDAKQHPELLTYSLLQRGISETCYDGQYYFDTDHPVGLPGQEKSVSNYAAGTGPAWYLLDTSKMLKPMVFQKRRDYDFVDIDDRLGEYHTFMRNEYVFGSDARVGVGFGLWQLAYCSKEPLTPENYAKARTAMRSLKGDNGQSLNVNPTVVIHGPSNELAALEVTQSKKVNGKDNLLAGTAKAVTIPYLD